MPASEKHHAIEYLFDSHLDATGQLTNPIVTQDEVQAAIEWSNANRETDLSPRNPANFMKDIVRGLGGNRMWPERLRTLRITADQVAGDNAVFRFMQYAQGQTEPFPNPFTYKPDGTIKAQPIQSLSLPAVTKALGRDDENYLIQVAVRLSVIETHFALTSPLQGRLSEVHHLQVGLKLRKTEIDTMFLASLVEGQQSYPVLITAEAKKRGQRIVESQIKRQVEGALKAVAHIDRVVPIAMTSTHEGIYVVEFEQVLRANGGEFELELVAEGFYKLVPPVNGIGYKGPKARAAPRARER